MKNGQTSGNEIMNPLPILPADKNSVKSFDKFIVDYIIKFQKMHF